MDLLNENLTKGKPTRYEYSISISNDMDLRFFQQEVDNLPTGIYSHQ